MNLPVLPLVFSLLLLAGCAGVGSVPTQWQPPRDNADFTADGRLAVQTEGRGSYANFDWARQNGVQTIDINTPLGNTIGRLCRDPQGVLAVNSKGERFEAANVRELSERLLGFVLPLQYLDLWAHGQWSADEPHQTAADGSLRQAGWDISRSTRADGSVRTLSMTDGKLSLRLVFDSMRPSENSTDAPNRCAARNNS
ncbi:Outer-membrane lipoprotein lolB precursor [Kingella potus]|uniref:Outer-membrane lipoprotein LolB n=1 Tax=Kingella potus TaxID=265175 RepID=A0A377QZ63_9NEIS|nr:outer membrane lipoprotein LolB [Kingella potus]STR00282.1 Outer-membrane lipoprotein lolB precursor [Kingella potus]